MHVPLFRFSYAIRKTKNGLSCRISFFDFRSIKRKTKFGTTNRFSIFVSRTKIENRYDKPFFVFRLTERKSKNKKRKTSGATVAFQFEMPSPSTWTNIGLSYGKPKGQILAHLRSAIVATEWDCPRHSQWMNANAIYIYGSAARLLSYDNYVCMSIRLSHEWSVRKRCTIALEPI